MDLVGTTIVMPDARIRTKIDVPTLRRSIAITLKRMGVPAHLAGEVLGVHRNTISAMTSPQRAKVPAVTGVVFGSGEWTPECQDQGDSTCNRCGGEKGVITRGSRLYCAACHRTGFDGMLEKERIEDIFSEATAAECESQAKKTAFSQRRKHKKK